VGDRLRRLAAHRLGQVLEDDEGLVAAALADRPGDRGVVQADDLDLAADQAADSLPVADARRLVAAQQAEAAGVVHPSPQPFAPPLHSSRGIGGASIPTARACSHARHHAAA
jgi:hypothetical protein